MGDLASLLASADTPPTPPTPSAPAAPAPVETPEWAEEEINSLRTNPVHRYHKAFTTPGHPHADKALAYLQSLYAIKNGAAGREGSVFREAGDGPIDDAPSPPHDPEAGGLTPVITDATLRESLGSPPLGAKWEPERIERLSQAAKPEGLASALPAILGVVAAEYERGCPAFTPEQVYDALEAKYGEHEADEIVLAADAVWQKLPHAEQAWLTTMRLNRNPRVLLALATAWRRRRTGQDEKAE
jgi:hypothetical protein